MNHSTAMGEVEARAHFFGDSQRVTDRKCTIGLQSRSKRPAGDELRDVIQQPIRRSRVEQRHDVRVRQASRDTDFAKEALLTAAAVVATLPPARRAARVDPIETLRME